MASKALATSLLTLNLLIIMACSCAPTPSPTPTPTPTPPAPKTPTPAPSVPKSSPPPPSVPKPSPPPSPPPPSSQGHCPMDALKLGVCANLLGGLVGVTVGSPPTSPCCSLLEGLVDLEAAVCLCTALKGGVLGHVVNIPVALSLILNNCGKNNTNYQCR